MSAQVPVEIDAATGEVAEYTPKGKPARYRAKLDSIADVRREMCRLYRESRSNLLDVQDCSRLVYVLKQIGDTIRDHELEQRIEVLESKQWI